MNENDISKSVLDAAFKIHKQLGPGLFESVYESVLEYELINKHNSKRKKASCHTRHLGRCKIRYWFQVRFNC